MATAKFIGVYACNTWPQKNAAPGGRKHNWFVWEDGWGRYRAQLLDRAFQPLDAPHVVTEAELKEHFVYQQHILVTPISQLELGSPEEDKARQAAAQEEARRVKQDIAELSQRLGIETPEGAAQQGPAAAPRQAEAEDAFSAADYEKAAQLDNETRIDFALALTRWRRGEKDRSMSSFRSILKLQDGIIPAHKHMYTDFAIDLRKCALASLAKEFYRRAAALAPEDCNALFNLARIYFETGEIQSAVDALDKAMDLEPDFDFALKFRRYLETNYPKQVRKNKNTTPLELQKIEMQPAERQAAAAADSKKQLQMSNKYKLSI